MISLRHELLTNLMAPFVQEEGVEYICYSLSYKQISKSIGLISVVRGTKTTHARTIPRLIFKSYTKDLSFPTFGIILQHRLPQV